MMIACPLIATLMAGVAAAATIAQRGWRVPEFASGLHHPRQRLLPPNGDGLTAEARTTPKPGTDPDRARGPYRARVCGCSADRITLPRANDRDGVAEQQFVLMDGLNQPSGVQATSHRDPGSGPLEGGRWGRVDG